MVNKELVYSLTTVERQILTVLTDQKRDQDIEDQTGLEDVEVARGIQWLANKDLINTTKEQQKTIRLAKNGKKYVEEDLPERLFLETLQDGPTSRKELLQNMGEDEVEVCIGLLKQNDYITIDKDEDLVFTITDQGRQALQDGLPLENLLSSLPKKEQNVSSEILNKATNRKDLVEIKQTTTTIIELTEKGKKVKNSDLLNDEIASHIKREDLKTGTWKEKTYRYYDVDSDVPRPNKGRKHFVNETIEYVKNIYLSLGFQEMSGGQVQSSFWNLDALFVPQDHPAREMQDTFYLDVESNLPDEYVEEIKQMHEHGWGGFSEDIAKKTLLRTHTTVLSARTFSELSQDDLPKKFFVVGKNYRNEALDWKHLFEFHQIDGIVIDEDGSLARLKGHLKDFFGKMGYPDARIRPAYFPYTEPSCEVDVYHPEKQEWVEIGGAGVIRPEITKALIGYEVPVMAWGLGLERIIMNYFDMNDLRKIYENDIQTSMNQKLFMR